MEKALSSRDLSQTNEVLELIGAHRSVRKYHSTPIPEKHLEEILSAGLRASSAGNLESWSVVVTRDAAIRAKLYELHYEQDMVLQAPAVFTFCADFNRTRRWIDLSEAKQSFDDFLGFLTGLIDAALVAQNMALAAESLGLGICYMGTTLWAMDEIGKLLKLPRHVIPITSFVIGYPAEEPRQKPRLPLSAVVHYEEYGRRDDREILGDYETREQDLIVRRASLSPEVQQGLDELKVTNLAGYYTSPYKYSKDLHQRVSAMIRTYLENQGFWP